MNDIFLVFTIPILVVLLGAIYKLLDSYFESKDSNTSNCKHEYSEWNAFTTEYAYVQQKQCNKCKYVYTYQLRKITKDEEAH